MKCHAVCVVLMLSLLLPLAILAQSTTRRRRTQTPKPPQTTNANKPGLLDDLIQELRGGPGWRHVTTGTSRTEVYYHPQRTVRKAKGIIRTWVKHVYVESNRTEDEWIALKEFDCVNGRERTLQETVYYRSGRGTTSSRPTAWAYITPDSVTETVYKTVCSRKPKSRQ